MDAPPLPKHGPSREKKKHRKGKNQSEFIHRIIRFGVLPQMLLAASLASSHYSTNQRIHSKVGFSPPELYYPSLFLYLNLASNV